MIGKTYLLREPGMRDPEPVTVLVAAKRGGPPPPLPPWIIPPPRRLAPLNVWIRRADGSEVVRPFRGLRLPPA